MDRVGHLARAHDGRRGPARGPGCPLSRGRFIALEGVDGSGKTTQATMLAGALRAEGQTVVLAREPGATALGERVRALLLDGGGAIAPAAEALLFAAARAQLVADVVRPALDAGAWVVCDRFVDSSLAYQGAARGLGIDAVWAVNELAVAGCLPDLALVLELPVGTARTRKGAPDGRIEEEGAALQERVAEGYRELARRFPERVALLSSDGSPEDVHAAVMARVMALKPAGDC